MTLISILIGLGLEFFLGTLDRIRDYRWFDAWCGWLEKQLSGRGFWDGPVGILITVGLPLILLDLIAIGLRETSVIAFFIMATVVFLYSLGPNLNTLLDGYSAALESGNEADVSAIEERLLVRDAGGRRHDETVLRSILIRSQDNMFGVIFWFIVLGITGALLFALSVRLKDRFGDIHGGYGDAARHLHRILIWPTARLQVAGMALAGNLVEALERWRGVEGETLECSNDVVASSGLGAVQYHVQEPAKAADADNGDDAGEEESDDAQAASLADWVPEVQALINRAVCIWLTVLGVTTIGGWLS